MSNVNIKQVEGGEVTTLSDADGVEIDTGTISVWIQFLNLAKEVFKRINSLTEDASPQADDYLVEYDTSAGSAKKVLPSKVGSFYNYLINGGFDFSQRTNPAALTTVADNAYGPDQWRSTRENADLQYIRVDATGETGLTSKFYGQYKKITNAGKFHVVQILEGTNSVPQRSKIVTFQIKMKASSAKTIRMAVIELQNAGTLDSIPATLITAFGADTVDPTLGANLAVITGAESKNVTTSWQSFSVTVTVPSNSKNLLCAFWSDSDFAANDTLSVAEAGLFATSIIQPWNPRHRTEELRLCYPFYQKSFSLDTAPVQNVGINTGHAEWPAITAGATVQRANRFFYPVPMRANPTLTSYNPSASNAQARDIQAVADCSATTLGNTDEKGFLAFATGAAGTAAGNRIAVHWTAEAGL